MKYFLDLLAALKRGDVAPVYLFYGPEVYLREQALARFREALLDPTTADFNLDLLDGEKVTPEDIVAAVTTPVVMATRRLVIVKNAVLFKAVKARADGHKADVKPGEAALLTYLEQPFPDTCLIFYGDTVDKRRKLYKLVAKRGRAVEFSLLKPVELIRWLEQQTRQEHRGIQRQAAEELVRRCRNSLMLLSNEIEKLINYSAPGETITRAEVDALVPARTEDSIFAVVDAIGERQWAKATGGIRDLLLNREQPHYILAMIARQFRLILLAGQLKKEGCPASELVARLGVHPFVAKKVQEQGRNFTDHQLLKILASLQEVDISIKTSRQEFYPAMEMLMLKISIDRCG